MNKAWIILAVIGSVALLAILAALVGQVGGGQIRSASRIDRLGRLTPTTAVLLPGVPTAVAVAGVAAEPESILLYDLALRLPEADVPVRQVAAAELAAGTFTAVIPCIAGSAASLMLVESSSGALVAQSGSLQLLPPGPDCAFLK